MNDNHRSSFRPLKFLKPTEQGIEYMFSKFDDSFQVFDYIWEHGFAMGIAIGFPVGGVVACLLFQWVAK